jgi:hypothetical protein
MQCKSCQDEVPAKFAHAISINVCPLCGGQIIPEFIKNILNELKTVLDKAKDHFADVEDWLLANYNLRQIKDTEVVVNKDDLPATLDPSVRPPQGKTGKIKVKRSGEEDDNEEVEAENAPPLNKFAVAAGVNPKITSQRALEFIKGKAKQDSNSDALKEAFLKDEEGAVDDSPLDRNELATVQNMFEDSGNQVDEDNEHLSRMQKLKRLQR